MSDDEVTHQELSPPDFVFARKVLAHVKPEELPNFLGQVCRLLGEHTIGVIENPPTERTYERNPGTLAYALTDVEQYLPSSIRCTQTQHSIILRRIAAPVIPIEVAEGVLTDPVFREGQFGPLKDKS